jgi:hypothetical protein
MWQVGRGGEERLMSATVKQWKIRIGECGDQRRVTSPQRLKQLMK